MLISNYYCGTTNKISGFVYDTDRKTYKEYTLSEDEVFNADGKVCHMWHGWKEPADISYAFRTKNDMLNQLSKIKNLGFKENQFMRLDFGLYEK